MTYYNICSICMGYMQRHQNLEGWLKCPTCSFSKKEKNAMVTMEELLNHKYKIENQTEEIQKNLQILLPKINEIRTKWGKPMIITSGLRTMEDHLRIYKEKGIIDPAKIPMKSKHLIGAAVDISDPGLELTKWLKANPEVLEKAGLYCEEGNSNWTHFQHIPFGSYKHNGTRWFIP